MRRLIILLFVIGLAACAPEPKPLPTAAPTLTEVRLPTLTNTAAPSATSTATSAPTATATPTLAPTFTFSPSATPMATLDKAEVIQINDGIGGIGLVLKIPYLTSPYNLILGGANYECRLDAQYPDWLFCWGLSRPTLDIPLTEAFLDPQTKEVVFEHKVVLSSAILPTALPEGYANTNCPDRGKNISCETECRLDYDGNPCIVSTCTDACGLYRSVHTCPQDQKLPATVCNPEQWATAKAKNGIP